MSELEINSATRDIAGYEGLVTVSIMNGKKVVSTRKYHNNGTKQLFKFLSNCLAGNWESVRALRPCKLILFDKNDAELPSTFNADYWTTEYQRSAAVMYDSSVTPKSEEGGGYSVTFHFRVPFVYLDSNASIYKLGLFPNNISSLTEDICAYFFITKEDDNSAWGDPITVPVNAGNFTVIIDWQLIVDNKASTQSTNEQGAK